MITGRNAKKYLAAVLLVLLASPAMGLGIYADDFESAVVKGVIDPATPFAALEAGETFGAAYREGGTYYLYTSYAANIYVRKATDGRTWDDRSLVLTRGGAGGWDSTKVYCPMVWKEGGTYYMIYGGYDDGGITAVGLATASHPEGVWRKDPANPVYQNPPATGWSGGGAEPWGIQKVDGVYHLWVNNYGGAGHGGVGERQLGLVTSPNLREWRGDPDNPLFVGQRFCPFPFRVGEMYYLLVTHQYAGSDYAVLELYRCCNPLFHPEDREFVGVVLNTPRSSTSGFGRDLDTPAPVFTDATFVLAEDPVRFYYAVESGSAWKMGLFTLAHSALGDTTLFPDVHTSENEPSTAFSLSTDTSIRGSRSLKIAVTPSNECYRVFTNSDSGRISFWVNAKDSSSSALYGLSDRNAEVIALQMYTNMKLQYKDGDMLKSGTFVRMKGEWYRIVVDYSLADGTWSYTVLDASGVVREQIADIALASRPSRINAFLFYRVKNPAGALYIDDLRI
ncbi:MAG: family 43 glycosylhydrolase [Methanomicrobiales archaeon]|nr:family 43 glycosylhydrolase [Methanomicrobiales archaeon]